MNKQGIDGPLGEQGFCLFGPEACLDHLLGLDGPRSRGIFELFWIKEGAGVCSLDDETIVFGHSTLCLLLGRRFQLLHTVSPVQGYYISFSPSFLYPERPEFTFFDPDGWFWQENRTVVEVGLMLQSGLEESVTLLEKGAGGGATGAMVRNRLRTLLFQIIRQTGRDTGRELSGPVLVRRFQALVKRDLLLKKPVSAYARELGVSPNHLNQVVKRITGLPASYHLVQHKIAEAKRQIALHQWDLKTTAGHLGFKNLSNFCQFFKTNAGMSFSDYRQNTMTH